VPTPRVIRPCNALLLVFVAMACVTGWHVTFRDAVADGAIQKEPVPSNIISVEPARPATVTETGAATPAPAPGAPAAPIPIPPPEATPIPLHLDSHVVEPAGAPPSPPPVTAPAAAAFPESPELDIQRAMAANDSATLIRLAQKSPENFSCAHIDRAWALARAYAALGPPGTLFDLLAGLIDNCRERDRLATLQKAGAWIDTGAWERLAERESDHARTPGVDADFRRTRYDHDINLLLAAKSANDTAGFFQRFKPLSAEVERYQDANIALLAGWTFLDGGDTGNAALWFGRARDWRPVDADAARGLALCALAEHRFADARLLADGIPDGSEGREEILRNATVGMAQVEYDQKNYAAALQLLTDAGPATGLPRYAQLMMAWSQLHLGNADQALESFEQVHRQQADEESAQGIFNALLATGDAGALERYPADELLAPLLQKYHAERSWSNKRFLAAKDLAPGVYGASGGAGAPRAAWHGMLRDKSGTTGLSKLEDTVNSLEATWPVTGRSEITFRLDRHQLDSGGFTGDARLYLSRGLLSGALGLANDAPAFTDLAEAGAESLRVSGAGANASIWEPHLAWRNETRFEVEADIGLTGLGGVLDPRPIGHLSLRDSNRLGSFALTGYARPIRESILSYGGWRLDQFLPTTAFNGRKWGGVRATGAELSGYFPFGGGFAFNGKIGIEQIDAHNVRENSHESVLAGLNHGLQLQGFDYVAAGISTGYDHYAHNLSQFTPGHGGYFSPQTFWQFKANLDFLTLENQRAVVKGHLDGGRVFKREGATPVIPLDGFSDAGFYSGSREWGWTYTVELSGAMQIGNYVQVGADLSRRAAPQYDETAGMLFIRVLFEPRTTVLSSDLPGRVMDDVR
jgi:tetratricopeptide (TPR) repeat protein